MQKGHSSWYLESPDHTVSLKTLVQTKTKAFMIKMIIGVSK